MWHFYDDAHDILLCKLLQDKNDNYGDSGLKPPLLAPHIDEKTAILVRLSDKVSRLAALSSGEPDKVGESIADTVTDIAGYCILWLVQNANEAPF